MNIFRAALRLAPLLFTASLVAQNAPASTIHPSAKVREAITRALPSMDGGHLKVSAVEVAYPPGGSSSAHSHPCPVVAYVVSGSIRSQVRGEAEHVYKAGETFYEAPNGVHQVSANASDREPATLVAFFVCDHEVPLTSPVASGGTQ